MAHTSTPKNESDETQAKLTESVTAAQETPPKAPTPVKIREVSSADLELFKSQLGLWL